MGDAWDELDRMLEEPYKRPGDRYKRSPPRASYGDRKYGRGVSPSPPPPPRRHHSPPRRSPSPPPQRRGPPPPPRGRRSPSPDGQWDRSPSPPPPQRRRLSPSSPPLQRRKMARSPLRGSESPPPPPRRSQPKRSPSPPTYRKVGGRSPQRSSPSPPPKKRLGRSPSPSPPPMPKRGMIIRRSPSASPPPPSPPPPQRGRYGSRSPPPKMGGRPSSRSPDHNGNSPPPPPKRSAHGRSPMRRGSSNDRRRSNDSPPPPPSRGQQKRTSPSWSPPRYGGRSPSPPKAARAFHGGRADSQSPPPRPMGRAPSRSPSLSPPRKVTSWKRSPSRSPSPPANPHRSASPGRSLYPKPPKRQASPSPPPQRKNLSPSPPPKRGWSPKGGSVSPPPPPKRGWSPGDRASPSPPPPPPRSGRSPSPLGKAQSPPANEMERSFSGADAKPTVEKGEKNWKENGDESKGGKRRKSRSKSPKTKKSKKSRSKSPGGSHKRSPSKKRSRSRERGTKERRRSRSRDKWGDRDRGRYGPRYAAARWSPPRGRRAPSPDRRWGRPARSPPRRRERSKERERKPRSPSPARSPEPTPEERDLRTVLCMQLSPKLRERDLREFMSAVGQVRDVRVIADPRTKKCKGVAYVEFKAAESVALAIGLTGQKLLGIPIQVLPSGAEKNRAAQNTTIQGAETGPMRIYVGSLHYNITEAMLRGIFEPFGAIDSINLLKDPDTGLSRGYGFITFTKADDARRAIDQLNGFEIAGRPMKVANVTEKTAGVGGEYNLLDDIETKGINMGAAGRIHLMAKLAEGTGFQIPAGAAQVLQATNNLAETPDEAAMAAELARQALASVADANAQAKAEAAGVTNPPINTTCFMLTNMFDPASESNPDWETEIRDDVIDECTSHGGAVHVHVDKAAPQGNVYVKVLNATTASLAVNALHGRMFAGRVITAAYIPEENYVDLFPDSRNNLSSLKPSRG